MGLCCPYPVHIFLGQVMPFDPWISFMTQDILSVGNSYKMTSGCQGTATTPAAFLAKQTRVTYLTMTSGPQQSGDLPCQSLAHPFLVAILLVQYLA